MDRIELGFHKVSAAVYTGAAIVFSVIAFGMLVTGYARPASFMGAVLIISGIFFALGALVLALRSFSRGPALIIDETGFVDGTTFASVGRVDWNDVQAITHFYAGGRKFLGVIVHEPEEYIANGRNGYVRYILKKNYKWYRTPIAIDADSLSIEFEELEETLNAWFELSKL